MKGNKGKKVFAALLAGTCAVAAVAGGMAAFNAVPAIEEKAEIVPDPVKLNTYKFFDSSSDSSVEDTGGSSYKDGYWGKLGESYRPLWTVEHTEGDKTGYIILEPTYFRTEDGKVAYCIEADKKAPSEVMPSDNKVPKKAYAVVKAGYPGKTGRSDASDIELEWATTWAVKKVTGNPKTFDDYKLSNKAVYTEQKPAVISDKDLTDEEKAGKTEEEISALIIEKQRDENARVEELNRANKEAADKAKADAERIRKVAEELAAVPEVEYDKFDLNEDNVKITHKNGVCEVGPYVIDQNIGAKVDVKLVNAPAGTSIIEDNGSYYVNIPDDSIKNKVSFQLVFTGDKQMLDAMVYVPSDSSYQKIYVYNMIDSEAIAQIEVEPELAKGGQIKFVKMDEDGKTPLANVEFEIYNSKSELVDTVKTAANGEAVSKILPYGSYTAVETKAPDGYMLSKEVMKITLNEESGNDITLVTRTVTNKKNVITILKVDSKTNKGLENATLVVKNEAGQEVFVGKTDKDGKLTMTGLAAGKYTVTEKEAPAGYSKTDEAITFTVDKYGAVTGTTTLKNEALKDAIIKKVGSDNKNKGLEGAVIEVYDSAGQKVLNGKTDKNGELSVKALAPGKYTFKEIEAPAGYALSKETYTFEVLENGEIKGTLEIVDKPIVVELKKTDMDGKELEGAVFTVKNNKNETVFTGKTNSKGIVKVEKLVAGSYTVTETTPPSGYKLNSKSFSFKVDEYGKVSGTTTIKDEITTITITKKDKADNKVLAGAKITIKDENGKVVAEGKTDDKGLFVVKGLAPGTYVYTEDEAPEGYVRTNEKASFVVNKKGDDVNLTLFNSKLNLTKNTATNGSTKQNNTTKPASTVKTNSKGEIIKTGVDDTQSTNVMPILAVAAAVAVIAVIAVVVKKKKDE